MKKLFFYFSLWVFSFAGWGQTQIYVMDFDGTVPEWSFNTSVTFFDNNDDGFYGIHDANGDPNDGNPADTGDGAPSDISQINYTNIQGDFLFVNDLDDEGDNGTSGEANLTFANIDISNYNSVSISFDYDIVGFESNDYIKYEIFQDGTGQGQVTLPKNNEGTETISIPDNVNSIYIVFTIKQNGANDQAALDNIKLEGESTVTDAVDWCNIQWPETGNIRTGDTFNVYAQVYEPGVTDQGGQGSGIEAWIGYSSVDNDPTDSANASDWTWVSASYNTDSGNNDEYMVDLGGAINTSGTFYYASRFRLNGGPYKYGGYDEDGNGNPTGDFWEDTYSSGTGNHSGKVDIDIIDWCNLQHPADGTIDVGNQFEVYFQIYEEGVTDQSGKASGITAWLGYSTVGNDPSDPANASDWTWVSASYNTDIGNNDEYKVDLGSILTNPGTYYYASRFQLNNGPYAFGGYNGGFWQNTYSSGGNNKSGQLQVLAPEISVEGNGTEIVSGDTTPDTDDDTDFGSVLVTNSVDHTFTIKNTGNKDLILTGSPMVAITGDTAFSIITQPSNSVVSTGGSETFTVHFAPTTAGNFSATISIDNDDSDENPYTFTVQGTGIYSNKSDIVANGNEAVSVSSLINDADINTISDGIEVWQFTIRDGGADLSDADGQPTILKDLIITQAAGNAMNDWGDALQAVALFDENTLISNTPTIISNQIRFTGLNFTVPDNTQKTLSLRISIQNSPNDSGSNNDGDDFVFQISQGNVTADSSGSQFTNFSVQKSANGQNVFEVIATQLVFTQQPTDIGQGSVMVPYPEVSATDANGNVDLDFSNDITLTSTGTITNDPITVTATKGVSVFDNVVHTVTGNGFRLTATSPGLTAATSNSFDVLQQTILQPGDLAILAINTDIDGNSNDQIVFVCFQDIAPGTKIYLTDNGYERKFADEWGGTEGVISITRKNSTLPAGTIIVMEGTVSRGNITLPEHFDIYTCGAIDNNWTKEALSGSGIGGFNLNSDDDIWIMQGGTWNNDKDHHSTYDGTVLYGWTESGWDNLPPDGSDRDTKFSNLYENSSCFITVAPSGGGKVKFNDPNDPDFSTTTFDQLDWIALINTSENWDTYSSNADYNSSGFDYKGDTNCPQLTISANTHVAGKWKGTNNANWFDCSNWDNLTVPDENTDVVIDSNADNEVIIDAGADHSDLYNDIAKTKNLLIQENIWVEVNTNKDVLEIHGDLTIANNAILDANDGDNTTLEDGRISIYGHWINNYGENGFDQGNSTVTFMGAAAQAITQTNGTDNIEKFYNLEINNPHGVTFASGNIHADGLLTFSQSPDLIIPDGKYILAGNGLINNGINITVENEGNFIQTGENATITDLIAANYKLKKISNPLNQYYEYVYWSSPIKEGSLQLGDIVNNAWGYYEYDPADNSYPAYPGWIAKNSSDLFQTGLGYAISAPNGTTGNIVLTPEFTSNYDPFNSGNLSYTLRLSADNDPNGDDDYNLIGNPYPSALDFDKFATDNPDIEAAYYAWTNCAGLDANLHHQEQGYTIYSVESGSTKSCSGTGLEAGRHISTAQGFMVEAIGNGPIRFKNTHRSFQNNNFINKPGTLDRFWLDLTNSDGAFNQILVAFSPQATDQYDRFFDAHYLDSGNGQEFYSINHKEKWARRVYYSYRAERRETNQPEVSSKQNRRNSTIDVCLSP